VRRDNAGGTNGHAAATGAEEVEAGGGLDEPAGDRARDGIGRCGDGAACRREAVPAEVKVGDVGGCKRRLGPGAAALDIGARGMAEGKRHATRLCAVNFTPTDPVASLQRPVRALRALTVEGRGSQTQLQMGPPPKPAQQAAAMTAVWHAGALRLVPVPCQLDGSPCQALLVVPRRRGWLMAVS
jgi:hypothetical protein